MFLLKRTDHMLEEGMGTQQILSLSKNGCTFEDTLLLLVYCVLNMHLSGQVQKFSLKCRDVFHFLSKNYNTLEILFYQVQNY